MERYPESGMEVVDMRQMAFLVLVENNGNVTVMGQADAEYICRSLRSIADDMERDGWEGVESAP